MGAVQITALLLVNKVWPNITFAEKTNMMARTKYLYDTIFLKESANMLQDNKLNRRKANFLMTFVLKYYTQSKRILSEKVTS
jgi:hypothetical protein